MRSFRENALIVLIPGLLIFTFWFTLVRTGPVSRDDKTTVTWLVQVGIKKPLYETLVADFEKQHPDMRVRIISVPSDQYQTKLKIGSQASSLLRKNRKYGIRLLRTNWSTIMSAQL